MKLFACASRNCISRRTRSAVARCTHLTTSETLTQTDLTYRMHTPSRGFLPWFIYLLLHYSRLSFTAFKDLSGSTALPAGELPCNSSINTSIFPLFLFVAFLPFGLSPSFIFPVLCTVCDNLIHFPSYSSPSISFPLYKEAPGNYNASANIPAMMPPTVPYYSVNISHHHKSNPIKFVFG